MSKGTGGKQGGVMKRTLMGTLLGLAILIGAGTSTASADPSQSQPAQTDHNYTVQSGDTLTSISSTNATTYVRLYDANMNITNPDLIYPGQVLRIPAADDQLPNRPLPAEADDSAAVTDSNDTSQPAEAVPSQASYSAPTATETSYTGGSGVWNTIAQCESGGNWAADTGNGYYGGLQFTLSSWEAAGGTGLPSQASPAEQIARAQTLEASQGWGAWPVCSVKAGL